MGLGVLVIRNEGLDKPREGVKVVGKSGGIS